MLNERTIKAYQSVCAIGLFCLLDQYYLFVGKYYHFECSGQEMRLFLQAVKCLVSAVKRLLHASTDVI